MTVAAIALPLASFGVIARRGAARLLAGPRFSPGEESLGPALDALGGEVVRIRSRDGLRLAARWLPAEAARDPAEQGPTWVPDPSEAILLLHGYSGSVAPDLVEYGPALRTTAGVLGLDFRGHGGSDDGPTTFGVLEVEDIAGALVWLGERGVSRVAFVGTSMGGMAALAAVAVLGDGTLTAADASPDAPRGDATPRPRIVAVVGDSIAPEIPVVVANRIGGPLRRLVAERLVAAAGRRVGTDLRATEPLRIVELVEPVPLLLIHGDADTTVPIADGRRLMERAGPSAEHWVVRGAEHSRSHQLVPDDWEARVSDFLRVAFTGGRQPAAILAAASTEGELAARRGRG